MSAEHIAPVIEETSAETMAHLRVVDETNVREPSLAEKARIAPRSPEAAYKEARACYMTDKIVYSIANCLRPTTQAIVIKHHLKADAVIEKIKPGSQRTTNNREQV